MKRKILIAGFTCLFGLAFPTAIAQISAPEQTQINKLMPQPVPTSPNVAALGKFGDYQVSYFTGLPEISIPIFEAKSGNLSVPISLSYHPSGVKPTDRASWVGMGWALSAGGQISRGVHGKADEELFYTGTLVPSPAPCTNWQYLKDAAMGNNDTEPDAWSYSFPGKSGKFILSQGGNPPFLLPYAPIIVSPTFTTSPNIFSKFEITDEHGVLHRFGTSSSGATSKEYSNTTNGGVPTISPGTAWHLMESVAPNSNDQITYSYQPVGTSTMYDISYNILIQDNCDLNCSESDQSLCPKCPFPTLTTRIIPSNTTTNQQGLSTITFKTGKVDFLLGSFRSDQSQLQSLDRINIYSLVNGAYVLEKSVKFVYSYFTNALGGSAALKLDMLQFLDNAGAVVEQYRFTYATNSFSWDGTNPNFMNARDLWGYYNGAMTNTNLILPTTIPYQDTPTSTPTTISFGGATDRTVHTQYVQEGVLSRIDFPTGGYTQFTFESNQYDNAGVATLAGGLRVSKISSYDGSGAPPKIKTYKYGLSESGKGIANFSAYQFNYFSQQFLDGVACSADVLERMTYRSRSYYSNSSYSQDSFDSSPVMYPYVTEYFGDPAGTTIGKVIYEYDLGTPQGEINQVIPMSTKYYTDSFFWKRGKLTHSTTYDNANNKISETSTTYSTYSAIDKIIGLGAYQNTGYILQGTPVCKGACTNEVGDLVRASDLSFVQYSQSSGALLENQTTEYTYENGNVAKYVMKQTSKTFDANKYQLTQSTVSRNNTNEQSVTVNQYPFQLTANASSTGAAQGIYMLNQKNIVASPVETYTYLENTDHTNQRVVSGQVTSYRQNASNTSYVVPDQIYLWESVAPLAKSSYIPVVVNAGNNGLTMDAGQKPRINIVNYDDKGNVQEVSKTNDVMIAYKYGYNNALPIAEVRNAQNTQYQYITNNQITGSVGITMGAAGTTVTQSYPFTVDYTGTVTLKLGVAGNPGFTTNASYSNFATGSINPIATGGCGLSVVNFPNIAPGNYTLTVTLTSTGSGVGGCGEIDFPKYQQVTNTGGIIEFLYESFEENPSGISTLPAHSGSKYYNGDFVVSFTMPNGRSYIIEYWYLDATNVWQYITKPYTGTSMTLTEGSAIDDVRIYPTDAQMKSYTYDPVLSIRSIIDESSRTFLYEYDSFGRLARIKNDKGGIEKQYTYNYKGN